MNFLGYSNSSSASASLPPAYTEGPELTSMINEKAAAIYSGVKVFPESQRKVLLERVIEKHNADVGAEGSKISLVKEGFSTQYPKLSVWIKNNFSQMPVDCMCRFAFGLGHFNDFSELVKTASGDKMKTDFIKRLFQQYGSEKCFDVMSELCYTIVQYKSCGFDNKYIANLSSGLDNSNTCILEVIPEYKEMDFFKITCYRLAVTIVPHCLFSGVIQPIDCYIYRFMESLSNGECAELKQSCQNDPFQVAMYVMDDFIRRSPSDDIVIKFRNQLLNSDCNFCLEDFDKAAGFV